MSLRRSNHNMFFELFDDVDVRVDVLWEALHM